jgi:hypothetical protein
VAVVDASLSPDPKRRPAADEFALALRRARPARRKARVRPADTARGLSLDGPARATQQLVPAALTGVAAAAGAAALSFYPTGWAMAIGAAAGAASLRVPRVGLAIALAAPLLPLGNHSLGLALAYAVAAALWLGLFLPEPRWALLPALGPALGAIGLLGLLPLLVQPLRSPVRRALAAAAALALAALTAGYAREALPLGAGLPPLGLGIAESDDPGAVGTALLDAARAYPDLLLAGLVLAATAAALPFARGRWERTGVVAVLLAGTVLAAPAAAALPLVLAAWVTWAVCVARPAT